MAAVAREVIEAYGDASGWAMANPVGTGPYLLKSWRRGAQIVLEANPNYRDETFPDSDDPADRELVARMRGKKLPIVGRIEICIIEESNPRLLAFNSGALDYVNVPSDLSDHVLDAVGQAQARVRRRAASRSRASRSRRCSTRTSTWRTRSSAATPRSKIALRRAIAIGFDRRR